MKQCVYITGGSSCIGLGLAHFYAKVGDDIILLARDQVKLDRAVDSCKNVSVNGGQVIRAESLDVTDYQNAGARRLLFQVFAPA